MPPAPSKPPSSSHAARSRTVLTYPATAQAAVAALTTPAALAALNTQQVIYGADLVALFGNQTDRIPDFFISPLEGTVYTGSTTKVSDHGGARHITPVLLLRHARQRPCTCP